jgi:hypothetical protein
VPKKLAKKIGAGRDSSSSKNPAVALPELTVRQAGAKGGKSRSQAKVLAAKANVAKARKVLTAKNN